MNRQRLLAVLWASELAAGVLPAAIMVIVGLVPYLVTLPAMPSMLLSGDVRVMWSAIVLNGTMVGGILGIVAILMAYRPEKLRANSKLKRRAIVFGCAGVCAEVLYLTSGGLANVRSNMFARWIMLGPAVVGAHCAYRVFMQTQRGTEQVRRTT
ncbi:MAG: hypothetical protein WAM78_17370 [Candidatus Sulfotelmatobacter sp.]|jgi:hypothetical protein